MAFVLVVHVRDRNDGQTRCNGEKYLKIIRNKIVYKPGVHLEYNFPWLRQNAFQRIHAGRPENMAVVRQVTPDGVIAYRKHKKKQRKKVEKRHKKTACVH